MKLYLQIRECNEFFVKFSPKPRHVVVNRNLNEFEVFNDPKVPKLSETDRKKKMRQFLPRTRLYLARNSKE